MDVSPTMRAVGIRGVFASREESTYVVNRLKPTIEDEFRKSGFEYVAATSLGPDMVFSIPEVRSIEDLRKLKIWHWDIDKRGTMLDEAMGMQAVPAPIEDVARVFEEKRADGIVIQPGAMLAFQWIGLVRHALAMPIGWTYGCLAISSRTFSRMPLAQQQIVRAAGAKAAGRIDDMGHKQDEEFLAVLPRQGVQVVQPVESMRAQYLAVARAAREKLGERLLSAATLQSILAMLADYRAEHSPRRD
jgi:TRAP-type C4-dicarboxylate transport system substrate-binding protein